MFYDKCGRVKICIFNQIIKIFIPIKININSNVFLFNAQIKIGLICLIPDIKNVVMLSFIEKSSDEIS